MTEKGTWVVRKTDDEDGEWREKRCAVGEIMGCICKGCNFGSRTEVKGWGNLGKREVRGEEE